MKTRDFIINSLIFSAGALVFPEILSGEKEWEWWITYPHPMCPQQKKGTKEGLEKFLKENFAYTGPLEMHLHALKQNSGILFKKIHEGPIEFLGDKKRDDETLTRCYRGDDFGICKVFCADIDNPDRHLEIKSGSYQTDISITRKEGRTVVPEFSELIDGEKIAAGRRTLLSEKGGKYFNIATFGKSTNPPIEIVEVLLPSIYMDSLQYENSVKPHIDLAMHLLRELPNLNKHHTTL